MKKAVSGIFNKIPKKPNSHVRGWAQTWAENLGCELHEEPKVVDVLYVDHGANFTGGLNLFGGFTQDLKDRIDILMRCDTVISLDRDMPEYGEMLRNRKDVKEQGLQEWCDKLSAKLEKSSSILGSEVKKEWLAVGDSHTAAYSRKDSAVVKRDGTTLFGQVKENFGYLRDHIESSDWKGVTISLGNIDVRHHFCRINTDWKDLYNKLFIFGDSLGCEVEYSLPWPIEYEERKLPKTGYYKDKPFWGSREQREELVWEIYDYMHSNSVNIVKAPTEWYKMDPEEYAKQKMEANGSVHLSPVNYRRHNWGVPEQTLELFFG